MDYATPAILGTYFVQDLMSSASGFSSAVCSPYDDGCNGGDDVLTD